MSIVDIHGVGPFRNPNYHLPLQANLDLITEGFAERRIVTPAYWGHLTGNPDSALMDYVADAAAFFDTKVEQDIVDKIDEYIDDDTTVFAHSMGGVWLMRWIYHKCRDGDQHRLPKNIITAGSPISSRLFEKAFRDLSDIAHNLRKIEWSNFIDTRDVVVMNPLSVSPVPEDIPTYAWMGCKTIIVNNGSKPHTGYRDNITVAARVFAFSC